jgi:NAD(P)-dependent dehydrogenase (short-subunit alcohol dehydrogenase family)
MAGHTVLVTGASDGIGAEAARVLAARGATVHVTGRSADKLAPVAEAVGTSLVVNTSSIGNLMGKIVLDDLDYEHRRATEFTAYGTGKLMNIVFTRGIAQRWSDDGVVSVAVHPGPVGSSFGRDSWLVGLLYRSPLKRFATISVADGAAPLIALAERGPDPEINGRYFSRFKADGRENKQAGDQSLIDGLWERSAALVGLP